MADLIDRAALIAEYDCVHVGAPGGARKLMQDAPAVNRWISVEEALPGAFIYVICAGEDGMAILRYNGEVWVDDSGCIYPMSAITHWMPLPKPPKEDET